MKKKVLFLGRFPPPVHGAAVMNENYFEALNKDKNFKVKKIKLNKYDSLENIGKIDKNKIKGFFSTTNELIKSLIKFKPKIIYLEMAPSGLAFYRDSIYILISKLFHKKIFTQFHAKGMGKNTKTIFSKLYHKFVFKKTKVILLSEILYSDVSKIIKRNQVEILPNGISDEITDKEFGKIIAKRKKNKKPVFLFLSNMIESKGPIDTLKICNELKKAKIAFECLFVGKFQDKEFEERFFQELKELDLEKNCKYLGPKYGKEKSKILERTNYLIFPTEYPDECYPLVILEAFMYGIPVFSYNEGAIKEIISENYLGYVSKNRKWEDLEFKLQERLKKTQNCKKIREYFKKNYVFNISAKKLKKILLKNLN